MKKTIKPIVPQVADLFTFTSIACGVLAIGVLLQGKQSFAGILMLCAVLLDWLDGRVARKLNQARLFGVYLDSVSDVATFAAVPAAIALLLVGPSPWLLASAALFVCAGAYRLARFQMRHASDSFEGMPITVNGIVVGGALLAVPVQWLFVFFPVYFVLSSVLMVSSIGVRKV